MLRRMPSFPLCYSWLHTLPTPRLWNWPRTRIRWILHPPTLLDCALGGIFCLWCGRYTPCVALGKMSVHGIKSPKKNAVVVKICVVPYGVRVVPPPNLCVTLVNTNIIPVFAAVGLDIHPVHRWWCEKLTPRLVWTELVVSVSASTLSTRDWFLTNQYTYILPWIFYDTPCRLCAVDSLLYRTS